MSTITQNRNPDGPAQQACFDYTTLGDELDAAKLPWRFYAPRYGNDAGGNGGTWSAYQAIRHIFNGKDWKKDVISPNWRSSPTFVRKARQLYLDHARMRGVRSSRVRRRLRSVMGCGDRQYGRQEQVLGFHRHLRAMGRLGRLLRPRCAAVRDYDGVGFRVPLLVISPYAKKNYVSHAQYETASVLRFAEDLYGLKQMAAADARANSRRPTALTSRRIRASS